MKIFADGADLEGILELADQPEIAGFTTNPTLMRKSGVSDYEGFARKLLEHITDRPISFEVFADEHDEMLRQARLIASWGSNVYVKIPVTDTRGTSTAAVVRELSDSGVHVNVTALLTLTQVEVVTSALAGGPAAVISVFAGRVADTGRDPIPLMTAALADDGAPSRARAAVGQPTRDPECAAGGRTWRAHHHGDARPAEEAGVVRPRPRRLLAGYGSHVP